MARVMGIARGGDWSPAAPRISRPGAGLEDRPVNALRHSSRPGPTRTPRGPSGRWPAHPGRHRGVLAPHQLEPLTALEQPAVLLLDVQVEEQTGPTVLRQFQ